MGKYVFVKINDDITSIKRLKEMFPNINEDDFEDILESDPTYTNNAYEAGKYSRWMLSLFNKNNLKKEDLYKAKEYLEKFDKKKAKFSNKDINTYKNLPDLYKAIEEVENKEPTKSELKRNVQRTDLDKDAELFMETENFKIYVPLTYEASCKLGSNTEWCTATRSNREYYDRYTEDGNELYIFISKKDPSEKYQWNTQERYTCDRKDERISEITLCIKYPDLAEFFARFGYNNIEDSIKKAKEYIEGKEYIYDGEEIDEGIKPYLKKVKVLNGVESIEYYTFRKCNALESIEIPNSVESIEGSAFYNCKSLKSIKLPNSLTSIEDEAFYNCSSLTSIEIPNSVTEIGCYAFSGCSSLKNITIPNSVKSIGKYAFNECRSLASIEIPNSVIFIGEAAFRYCCSLTKIIIPNSIGGISNNTFYECKSLTNVIMANGVSIIGYMAFNGCKSLKSIELPNSITYIGHSAFSSCESLEKIKIPNSVTYLGSHAVSRCSSLKNIEIPDSIVKIVDFTFLGCTSLKTVIIPNSVKVIEPKAFVLCSPDLVIKTKNPYVIDFCKKNNLKYSEE